MDIIKQQIKDFAVQTVAVGGFAIAARKLSGKLMYAKGLLNGKPPNCFPADTLVGTEHGPRPIQDVRASDRVWAFDLAADEWKLRQVIETYQHEHVGNLVAGEVIESTGHHPWWVVRGEDLRERPQPEHVPFNPDGYNGAGRWVDAIDLRVGDVLLLRSGNEAAIIQLIVRQARLPVYNFQVEELHCYAVGHAQVLVHNNSLEVAFEAAKGFKNLVLMHYCVDDS